LLLGGGEHKRLTKSSDLSSKTFVAQTVANTDFDIFGR
jgi:hypothetical protein